MAGAATDLKMGHARSDVCGVHCVSDLCHVAASNISCPSLPMLLLVKFRCTS